MEPSGKDLSALQTSSRNQCCLATRDKSPDSNFLRDTACIDSLGMRELQGPVTGTCPCSNADFPCYAYYTAGILDCLDFGVTKPVCKQMRVSMHHRDSFSRMLCFEAIDVPVSESTASRLRELCLLRRNLLWRLQHHNNYYNHHHQLHWPADDIDDSCRHCSFLMRSLHLTNCRQLRSTSGTGLVKGIS